jgi:hypothetical protein
MLFQEIAAETPSIVRYCQNTIGCSSRSLTSDFSLPSSAANCQSGSELSLYCLFGLRMLFGRMDAKAGAPALAHLGICNAEPRLLFYFFLGDFMTPSAMHSHLPLRSIQVSTQT